MLRIVLCKSGGPDWLQVEVDVTWVTLPADVRPGTEAGSEVPRLSDRPSAAPASVVSAARRRDWQPLGCQHRRTGDPGVRHQQRASLRRPGQSLLMKESDEAPLSNIVSRAALAPADELDLVSMPGPNLRSSGSQPTLKAKPIVPEMKLQVEAIARPSSRSSVNSARPLGVEARHHPRKKASSAGTARTEVPDRPSSP